MIGIIDYGMGNLRSVQKALERVGAVGVILREPGEASGVQKLILPGVGAFADAMDHLRERGWVEPVMGFIESGRPLLGICLGLQLLFEGSEEDAVDGDLVPGLGVLGGRVVRFRQPGGWNGRVMKVPHMGWNTLSWEGGDPLLAGLEPGCAVYFVHSYYAVPSVSGVTRAVTDYGGPVCATAQRGNVYATQFHPEKSQRVGLRILQNFAEL